MEYNLTDIDKVAKKIARQLKPGDVVGFVGDLAAGKTTLISQIVKSFGYIGAVNSPTFVIEHRYPISKKGLEEIIHLDFYRLTPEALDQFDWDEYVKAPTKILLIEWPEIARSHLPATVKQITLEKINEQKRNLTFSENFSR